MIRPLDDLDQILKGAVRDAYQRGWDDATAALLEAASSKRPHDPGKQGAMRTHNEVGNGSLLDLNTRVTAREAVTQALEAKPGMQSSEIYQWTQVKGLSVTFEAVRTAIKRLRQKGAVVRYGSGYGLTPAAAPAQPAQ